MSGILYFLAIIMLIVSIILSANVNNTFKKWAKQRNYHNMTGAEAAQRILHNNGVYDVQIKPITGNLSDHYNPKTKELCLSEGVYNSPSVAAVAVAAHECGHAIQHANSYIPLKVRNSFAPIASFGSTAGVWMTLLGFAFSGLLPLMIFLADFGIILFAFAVIFHLITLPVEFNASSRALKTIETCGFLSAEEMPGAKKVLRAAALTYVAAALSSVIQLARFIGARD